MTTIPLRELRNNTSAVLRRAEAGERFTITVDGRPVADLVPRSGERWGSAADLEALKALGGDPTWSADLRAMREAEHEGEWTDPWA
ncbi:prevent-host-death family protein [Quadrisphaera granulorum]|uniref:Antitoxin n=1 Tax=Quadrisphaera granulorum TaxID=317664 RepID=A0A316AFJ5_9ACTN|nr:type II toxin-antitoxin system prevent-host-death family antitoxin [Quadrisphaera granulorum]PWJ56381.1 prevent-host-death family protein [Quadrisphaera granulorum]SZE95015.1 prevent-host-death family protein [Quadrisphaera granulorum]